MFFILSFLLFISVFCLLRTLLASGAALRLAADTPNQRSLHTKVTPRIGGIVSIPLAMLAAMLAVPDAWLLTLVALCLSLGSFLDDRIDLPTGLRFSVHILAAGILVWTLPQIGIATAIVCGFLIVWMTNLYNFMDGSDGLIGGMSIVGFGAYACVAWSSMPELAIPALFVVLASAAFLCFNFHPARVFMGDAGSIPLGFLAGGSGVVGWWAGTWPWWFPIVVFSPFIVDASVTLIRRILQGQRFWQAHREHYYQRLILMGWSHKRLALGEYALMASSSLLAYGLMYVSPMLQFLGLAVAALIYGILMRYVDLRWNAFKRVM